MSRLFFYLFCLFSFSQINAFECDGYELSQFEEDNIEEEIEDQNWQVAKSIFKHTHQKELPDSNNAMATLEAGPSAVVAGCVNAITGAFFESQCPLTIPGPIPLAVQCTYCSSEKKWRFQHMPKLTVGYSENHLRANYLDDSGSGMAFGVRANEKYAFDGLQQNKLSVPETLFEKGLTNCGSGEISGKTNWRNVHLSLAQKVRDRSKKSYILHHGSNVKRVFSRYRKIGGGEAPTGKFRLTSEQHPNGNYLLYQYASTGLFMIHAVNRDNEDLGSLNIGYNHDVKTMNWQYGQDRAVMSFLDDKKKKIKQLSSTGNLSVFYQYGNNLINQKVLPDGRFLKIDYYASGKAKERVSKLTTPNGIAYTFNYNIDEGKSFVRDAESNLTTYCYDKKTRRLQSVIRCDSQNVILFQDSFEWSNEKNKQGNLTARLFGDGANIYFKRLLEYDDFGNVKKDSLFGNLTGKSPEPLKFQNGILRSKTEQFDKVYTYDRRNLLLEEHDGQKTICYDYYSNQLLKSRLTKNGNQILKREFFEYDKNGILIKEIWDDGQALDEDDLSSITERHVKLITPRTQNPIGLPEIVEEQYLDLASNQYLLLKKTVNTHSRQGKLLQEDHYGSDGNFAYRLKWNYDRFGNVIQKIDALNQVTTYRYDENNNKIYEEGPFHGWHKEFAYDLCNNLYLEKECWPDGTTLITRHSYNRLNQRTATTDPQGNVTTFSYDALGRMKKKEGPGLFIGPHATTIPFEETGYDALGNPIIQKDANGYITKSAYTIRGKPYRIEHPDGSIERKEYSLNGLLVKEIAKNGLITEYTHDALNRVISTIISDPQGNILKTKSATYSTFHLLTETDEEGLLTVYEYDGAGRRIAVKKGDHLSRYQYDPLGRIIKTIDFIDDIKARVTCKDYDFLDRVIEERIEDESGQVFRKEQYSYDANDKRTSVTVFAEAGKSTTKTEYNAAGKPLLITDALGNQTKYSYNHHFFYKGQFVLAITKTDPLGNRETKVHDTHGNVCWQGQSDAFGRLIQEEISFYDPLGQKTLSQIIVYQGYELKRMIETTWEYDSMGNIFRSVEAENTPERKAVFHKYNDYGQKERTDMPNGVSIIHEYDSLGRLSSYQSTDRTIHYRYTYDKKDHPILVEDLVHDTANERSYDCYGCLQSETLDNGITLSYTYDHLDRPLSVTLPDQSSIRYSYNAHCLLSIERIKEGEVAYTHHYPRYDLAGNVLEETLLKQAGTIHYQYDLLHRPISVHAPHWQESIPNDGFDSLGNLLKRDVKDEQGLISYTYAYDLLNQLISEEGFVSHTYQNDSVYNRSAKDNQLYEINALNQLKSQTNSLYDYDRNGNLKVKTTGDHKILYVYDALDRLIEVQDGSQVTSYIYDSFHRRLSKTHDNLTTHYIYHHQNELGASVNGKITQLRVLGLAYGAEIGGAVALELNDTIYAPIHDPQGNIVALVDSTGKLIESYRYTAFGEVEVFSETSIDNPWRFSSKRFDPETGFIYFGRRYYDPDIGRWITPDPAGFADGPNLYAYVHNHPLAYIDPDGQLAWFLVPIAISLVADLCLPSAVAFIQPYTGAMTASFLAGMVKGYNCDFSLDGIDPACQCTCLGGMGLGLLFNANPKGALKATGNFATAANKALTNFMTKEAVEVASNLASKKVTQAAVSQASQKTAYAAEKYLEKDGLKSAGRYAESFVGRKEWELVQSSFQTRRNIATFIHNRRYSGHALDQMQNRGILPSVVENTINNGIMKVGKRQGTTSFYDPINNVTTVILNENKKIITTTYGKIN